MKPARPRFHSRSFQYTKTRKSETTLIVGTHPGIPWPKWRPNGDSNPIRVAPDALSEATLFGGEATLIRGDSNPRLAGGSVFQLGYVGDDFR